jgi:hypothetical protein
VVQGRDHHQGQHPARVGLRGHAGHSRPRGADAVRLHRRHRRAARGRLPHRAALAAADPLRRHGHRLRLGRRRALDHGGHRAPARVAGHRAGRAVRDHPGHLDGRIPVHHRVEFSNRPQPGHRPLRPRHAQRERAQRGLVRQCRGGWPR